MHSVPNPQCGHFWPYAFPDSTLDSVTHRVWGDAPWCERDRVTRDKATMMIASVLPIAAALAVLFAGGTSTQAADTQAKHNCRNTISFNRWLTNFRQQAVESGISRRTVARALNGMTYDRGVIRRDRGQSFFAQSFWSFQKKLARQYRVNNARRMIKQHRALFKRAERQFGVPPQVITGFWALESDFGKGMGKLSVLRSLTTLAYDCRRGEMFTAELMAALRLIDSGDLRPAEMIGSWAGELGQTQFLPTYYEKHAIDYDGDGRRNLFRSIPDIIGSSANYIKAKGWQAGQPWLQEVRVPARMNWSQASLEIEHPRKQWAKWGVRRADGRSLPMDEMPASLLLLMGRNGPAFLVYPNFRVYTEWNKSLNYATTAAYLATLISGAPRLSAGRATVEVMDRRQLKEVQLLLTRRGLDVGPIDGKLGSRTRAGVRQAQIQFGLPADSYPSRHLLAQLRRASRRRTR